MLGVWSQELRNILKPKNSSGKPSALEKQLKRIVSGAGQLELTAAVLAGLDREVERKAQRLKQRRLSARANERRRRCRSCAQGYRP